MYQMWINAFFLSLPHQVSCGNLHSSLLYQVICNNVSSFISTSTSPVIYCNLLKNIYQYPWNHECDELTSSIYMHIQNKICERSKCVCIMASNGLDKKKKMTQPLQRSRKNSNTEFTCWSKQTPGRQSTWTSKRVMLDTTSSRIDFQTLYRPCTGVKEYIHHDIISCSCIASCHTVVTHRSSRLLYRFSHRRGCAFLSNVRDFYAS